MVQPIQGLDRASHTFVVLYPSDETQDWFISVATRRSVLGGYEMERHDPDTGHSTKTIAAVPTEIATEVLHWISQR